MSSSKSSSEKDAAQKSTTPKGATSSKPAQGPLDRSGGPTRTVRQMPEPARFWIAHVPRSWRFCSEPWTDLARATLSGFKKTADDTELPNFDFKGLDDLFYIPPVDEPLVEDRDRLAASLVEAEIPPLVQLRPGESCDVEGVEIVYDLLPVLLSGEVEGFFELPEGAACAWPLVAGVTDQSESWDEGCFLLAKKKARCAHPIVVELEAKQRRKLAEERGDETFDALFHGEPPTERQFARIATEHGLDTFFPRPVTGHSQRVRQNRRFAAYLALAGEVSLRLHEVGQGQALLRAARGAESSQHDLEALAREKNLRVMDWIDTHGLKLIDELVEEGESTFFRDLMDRYLGRETTDGEDEEE